MKILNLYPGIGGNRKLWGDKHEITAVEINPSVAEIYKYFFPNDNVIVGDAHKYLLGHYKEFDFIWASPPCPSHSDIRRCGVHANKVDAIYPDMKLYQEIILLMHFAPKDQKWVIENVKPYYDYLIKPNVILQRHPFWTNINIKSFNRKDNRKHNDINGNDTIYGFNIKQFEVNGISKRKILRNMVNPEIGRHILNCIENKPNEFNTQLDFFE